MSRLDATAGTFVTNNQVIRPVHFIYMDFVGDPVRANDAGMDITITGMTQPDLNGTYLGLTGKVAELSPITVSDGGSAPITAKLSGLPTIDDATLALLADKTKWKGRIVRVWRIIWDQNNANQGSYQHLYTGYMVDMLKGGDPGTEEKTGDLWIEITIESYLVAFSQASNRTYLASKDFDPGDLSGDLAVSASLGAGNSPGGAPGGGTAYPGGLNGILSRWASTQQ